MCIIPSLVSIHKGVKRMEVVVMHFIVRIASDGVVMIVLESVQLFRAKAAELLLEETYLALSFFAVSSHFGAAPRSGTARPPLNLEKNSALYANGAVGLMTYAP